MADYTDNSKCKCEQVMKKVSETQKTGNYDKWARDYDKDTATVGYSPARFGPPQLAEALGDNYDARILDVAAGTGLAGAELVKQGFKNLDALDASQAMLDVAKSKDIYKNFICDFMGPNRLDIEENTYDAIITTASFAEGHLKENCLVEMIRIVKPGGNIVIGMAQKYLTTMEVLKDKLEPQMQKLHDDHKWKWVTREVLPKYHTDTDGVVFHFIVGPKD